jgi:hypothetical protein
VIRNIACNFGEEQRLKGVLSLPAKNCRDDIALVLVSAGFTGKPGPFRLYSELAQSLSLAGIATLRFDLGGIGNSQIINPGASVEARTSLDIKEALDLLQVQYGFSSFVVGGLCSGAEDAFHYAYEDERVKGVLLVDPHAYRTKMWWARNLVSRHFLNRVIYKILRVLRIVEVKQNTNVEPGKEPFEGSLIDYRYTAHGESARILQGLLERRVKLHYIYTGGRIDTFNHKSQFFSMFKGIEFDKQLTLDYIPHIEHTQEFEEDRTELISLIGQRITTAQYS